MRFYAIMFGMTYVHTDLIRRSYRGDAAHRHVTAISQFHRIQASPGYRAAAAYVAGQLEAAGLTVTVRRYPADGRARFWTTPSFLEWEAESATLQLLDDGGAEFLCDFTALPISLIQRSIPVEGVFEVVAPAGGGKSLSDYEGLDVRGKLVLTNQPAARVAGLAIRQLGAAGVLFDGMAAGGRSELDLPDARQYTSFWWGGEAQPDAWGFVLSPRQGRRLRSRLAAGDTIRVAAHIRSRFYPGAFEVVDALIPAAGGAEPPAEILLLSHLCHPQPGAHDNGSGAAALIETAASLARLIADGSLPPPRRGIRFLWLPEMTGAFAWLAEHEADVRAGRWIAGLNLDMVGADQARTGSSWELVGLPAAGAAFADHLLSWLREPFLDGMRHRETRFSAGSDHYILSDPSVDIPTPMLNDWPDKYYHTSADTPDLVSPDGLARSGALAAIYACWLASAGPADAAWLGRLMTARFAAAAARDALAAVEALAAAADEAERAQIWASYVRTNAFHIERSAAAIASLHRLDADPACLAELHDRAVEAITVEEAYVRGRVTATGNEPACGREFARGPRAGVRAAPAAGGAAWRAEAAAWIPRRTRPGPIDVALALQADHPALVPVYEQLSNEAGSALHDGAALLQYAADGRRTIAAIADRVEIELGAPVGEVALRYFKLLAAAGLVALEARSKHE